MRYTFLVVLAFVPFLFVRTVEAQTAIVHYGPANTPLTASSPAPPPNSQPVLFVHGHKIPVGGVSNDILNWQENGNDTNGLAFKAVLEHGPNAMLGIEPYYIRFDGLIVQNRSIAEDAAATADAVERILRRHDSNYATSGTTGVRVAIIAYSKGTLSTRYYLEHLLPTAFNPISEFVAIAPPNHGLANDLSSFGVLSRALRQLNNGWDENGAEFANNQAGDANFIGLLNGHDLSDTDASAADYSPAAYDSEAPGSRAEVAPIADGTLYVCLFADGNRDLVGGDMAQTGVQGRKLASNLATNAVNRTFAVPGGSNATTVHQNTVHMADVIFTALYAVVHHRTPPAGLAYATDGSIPLIPPRTAVKLVLDISGSMLGAVGQDDTTKLTVMQEAVTLFTNLWLETAHPADRLGVTYFGTQASALDIDGEVLLPMDDASATALVADVGGLDPATVALNFTAMGLGLLDGIAALEAGDVALVPSRHIVLLTDGMQNVSPLVSISPLPPTLDGTTLDTDLGIKVHTIEIGGQNSVMTLLNAIQTATDGTYAATVDPENDLNEFFVDELIAALQDHSPQLVAYRRGTLAGDAAVQEFQINRGARRLVLKLSWPRGNRLTYRVIKDGQDLTEEGRIREGPFYRIFALDSPAGGAWSMEISGDGVVGYEAAAIVDEPSFRYDLELARPVVRAGEPIEVTLKLGRADAEAVATVAVPGESTGNLLSKHDVAAAPPDDRAKDGTPAGRKLQRLVQDRKLWRRLLPSPRVVPLENNGDGGYSLSFGATTVPGPYRITVAIAAGDYRRSASITATVGIGAVDPDASDLRLDGRILHLRPRDAMGNFLGPGNAHLIQVEPASPDSLEDHLDGSYTADLGGDPVDLRIRIGDQILYDGPAAELERAGAFPWGWLLAAFVLLVLMAGIRAILVRSR